MARLALMPVLLAGAAMAAPPDATRQDELRHLVRQDCGSCHGLRRTGGLGRPITPEALAEREPGDLAEVILDGLPGTAMPGWRPLLTEDEARWIADYLMKTETE
ncbi:cytochrome c [uncultured Paracoccus sp.]|uniref:c-type cytochrome n=1 Tax=uncultured Paracoccus sp. TaxID=189685 RepID=UPI002596C953|nr:cytochrome c [uncultured Paracoccus sp.]